MAVVVQESQAGSSDRRGCRVANQADSVRARERLKRVRDWRDRGSRLPLPRDTEELHSQVQDAGFDHNAVVTERAIRASMRRQPVHIQSAGYDYTRQCAVQELQRAIREEQRLGCALAPQDPFRKHELYGHARPGPVRWTKHFGKRSKKRIKLRAFFKWAANSEKRRLYTYERIANVAAKLDHISMRRRRDGLMFAPRDTRAFGFRLCEECFRFVPDTRSLCTCQEGLEFVQESDTDGTSDEE